MKQLSRLIEENVFYRLIFKYNGTVSASCNINKLLCHCTYNTQLYQINLYKKVNVGDVQQNY